MVNFRYHIVSLIAVFLALGLGILMGSTVIDQGIVSRLEGQTRGLESRLDGLQAENEDLRRQREIWDAYGRGSLLPTVKGRLKDRSVVLVVQGGADPRMIDGLASTLTDAGASLAGRIALTDKWALKDDAARSTLAVAVDAPVAPAPELYQTAAAKLAARLAAGGDPAAAEDTLGALRQAGFVSVDPTGSGSFPPAGSTLLVVASGAKDARPPQNQFFVPMLRAFASAGGRVVVAEPLACADSLAERVRSDAGLRSRVGTVDHADIILGRVALVSTVRTLAAGFGAQHLGARRSAAALVPKTT